MPDCLLELDTGKLNSLAADHLGDLARINKGNFSRVINKSLENYWHVGLLHQMYPKAKFIFVHRDPMDIGLSVFSNSFNTRKFPYAYTNKLRDIGFAYRHIKKLMDHWVKTFSDSILEVEYEQILKTPEETARQLISHLDLEWDENCLEFHKKKKLGTHSELRTINQPIYTSSMGRWKPYERHLAELQESLKEDNSEPLHHYNTPASTALHMAMARRDRQGENVEATRTVLNLFPTRFCKVRRATKSPSGQISVSPQ